VVHIFWPVEKFAELANGPSAHDEVKEGWDLFVWTFSVTKSTVQSEVSTEVEIRH
jgi:hypothetical protein